MRYAVLDGWCECGAHFTFDPSRLDEGKEIVCDQEQSMFKNPVPGVVEMDLAGGQEYS